jgi:ribose transport system substrate-binding protein
MRSTFSWVRRGSGRPCDAAVLFSALDSGGLAMFANKLGWGVAALIALGGALWYRSTVLSEPAPPEVHVAMVTGGPGPYWRLIASGARASAAEHNVDLDIQMPESEENVEEQTKLLKALDVEKCDGVAISPLDVAGQSPLIDGIAEKLLVVTFDSDAPDTKRISYIGTSNVQAGRRAGRLVREAIPKGGKVVVAIANLTKDNMKERRAGLDDVLGGATAKGGAAEGAAYEVLDYLVDEGDVERSRELVGKAIEDNEDVACLVGLNAFHGPILLEVVKKADKQGKVAIIAFDEEAGTLAGVETGDIYATVVQDPYRYGYEAVKSLATLCRASEQQRQLKGSFSTFNISTITVTKDTVDEFRKQLAERSEGGAGEKAK